MSNETFLLDAGSLLSKWGFGDGDALMYWWQDRFDDDPQFDCQAVLCRLVRTHLAPAIAAAGHAIELREVSTTHNPIRADSFDGDDNFDVKSVAAIIEGIQVEVSLEDIVKAVPVDKEKE